MSQASPNPWPRLPESKARAYRHARQRAAPTASSRSGYGSCSSMLEPLSPAANDDEILRDVIRRSFHLSGDGRPPLPPQKMRRHSASESRARCKAEGGYREESRLYREGTPAPPGVWLGSARPPPATELPTTIPPLQRRRLHRGLPITPKTLRGSGRQGSGEVWRPLPVSIYRLS